MVKVIMAPDEASKNKRLKKTLSKLQEVTEYEESNLYVGDFLIGNYLIERKSTRDILTPNEDGSLHIFSQLDRLLEMREKGFEVGILVEGSYASTWSNKNFNQKRMIQARLNGIENAILFRYKIPIKKCDSFEEVREWVKNLIKRADNPNRQSLKALRTHPRRNLTRQEKALYILQGYKGIGPAKSKKILKLWKTLKNFFFDFYYHTDDFKPKFEKLVGKRYAEEFYTTMSYYYKEED